MFSKSILMSGLSAFSSFLGSSFLGSSLFFSAAFFVVALGPERRFFVFGENDQIDAARNRANRSFKVRLHRRVPNPCWQ